MTHEVIERNFDSKPGKFLFSISFTQNLGPCTEIFLYWLHDLTFYTHRMKERHLIKLKSLVDKYNLKYNKSLQFKSLQFEKNTNRKGCSGKIQFETP